MIISKKTKILINVEIALDIWNFHFSYVICIYWNKIVYQHITDAHIKEHLHKLNKMFSAV